MLLRRCRRPHRSNWRTWIISWSREMSKAASVWPRIVWPKVNAIAVVEVEQAFDPLVRRVAESAIRTDATPSDRKPVMARPRIDYTVIVFMAKRAFHGDWLYLGDSTARRQVIIVLCLRNSIAPSRHSIVPWADVVQSQSLMATKTNSPPSSSSTGVAWLRAARNAEGAVTRNFP